MNRPVQKRRKGPSEAILPVIDLKPVRVISPDAVLRIVRNSVICPALTSLEVAEAAKRRASAGSLLATAALGNMGRGLGDEETKGWSAHSLLRFLEFDRARRIVDATRTSRAGKQEREVAARKWAEQQARHGLEAGEFDALQDAVKLFASGFDAACTDTAGRPNRRAITDLYDLTDKLDHPLLKILPPIGPLTEATERDAVVQANHTTRFMIAQSLSPILLQQQASV